MTELQKREWNAAKYLSSVNPKRYKLNAEIMYDHSIYFLQDLKNNGMLMNLVIKHNGGENENS